MPVSRLRKIILVLLVSLQPIPGHVWNQSDDIKIQVYNKNVQPHVSKTTPSTLFQNNNNNNKNNNDDVDEKKQRYVPWPSYVPKCGPECWRCEYQNEFLTLKLARMGLKMIGNNFVDSSWVTELHLQDNNITEISNDAFENLPNLKLLNLSGNNVSVSRLLWFGKLDALRTLIVDENKCNGSVEEIFHPLPNLHELSLKRSGIYQLTVNLRTFAPRLTHLYLSGNKIESSDFVHKLPDTLLYLYLDDNLIANLESDIPASIKELSVSGNKINELCSDTCKYSTSSLSLTKATMLLKLNASRNRITEIANDTFKNAKHLITLDLSQNKLHRLSNDLFHGMSSLENLFLNHNNFATIPNICWLQRLKKLDLTGNQIVTITKENFCSHAPFLDTLLLADNRIVDLDSNVFAKLNSLTKLDLSDNLIIDFPAELITMLRHLEVFMIRNNKIVNLDKFNFGNSDKLRELHLQRNPLPYVTFKLLNKAHLPNLVIHLNDLPQINEDDNEDDKEDDNEDDSENDSENSIYDRKNSIFK
ncbi:extracellular matrix protein 2-like isoform X2 [Colletes latitarsis]